MNYLLAEPERSLRDWRTKLQDALSVNGQIIIDVIPELEYIIGKQKPVPDLGPNETQNRFHITFQNFISVFTKKEHPIVLFIDNLQWADTPSLNLLKLMVTDSESKYLFVIGAYRDNEVDSVHPLISTLEEVKKTSKEIQTSLLEMLQGYTKNDDITFMIIRKG